MHIKFMTQGVAKSLTHSGDGVEIIRNAHDAEFQDRLQIGVELGNPTADVPNVRNQRRIQLVDATP